MKKPIPKKKSSEDPKSKKKKSSDEQKSKIKIKRLLIPVILIVLAAVAYGTGFIDDILEGDEKSSHAEGTTSRVEGEPGAGGEKPGYNDLSQLEDRLAIEFIKTLRSEEYSLRYRTTTVYEGVAFEVETTYAVSGSSIALASGDRATIVSGNMVYMLNHGDKSMISWDVADSDNLKKIDTRDLIFLGSRQEGGLVCEEYQTASGTMMIYFDGDKPVKMATIINGLDTVMHIEEISKEAPADLFLVPENYRNSYLSQ